MQWKALKLLLHAFMYAFGVVLTYNLYIFATLLVGRVSGERYMNEVLIHGGQKPPAQMIESLLGSKPTIENLANSLVKETVTTGKY